MAFKGSLGRSLVVAGVLTCTAVSLTGGLAYAASPAPASSHHHSSAHHKTTMLTTRVANVHIRSRAKISKGSKVLVTLPRAGMTVAVRCHKTSTSVDGDTTWYRTVAPRAGFVAGHELTISQEPAAGVSPCKPKRK